MFRAPSVANRLFRGFIAALVAILFYAAGSVPARAGAMTASEEDKGTVVILYEVLPRASRAGQVAKRKLSRKPWKQRIEGKLTNTGRLHRHSVPWVWPRERWSHRGSRGPPRAG